MTSKLWWPSREDLARCKMQVETEIMFAPNEQSRKMWNEVIKARRAVDAANERLDDVLAGSKR